MEFYDFLFTVDESVYRTDRLMKEYNGLKTSGNMIANEDEFELFLSEFDDIVEVTQGGLTNILLNTKKIAKIHPRVNHTSYPSLKRSSSALARSLKGALKENNLNEASLDSYSWLTEKLRKHLGISQKEELQVVEELVKILKLDKKRQNTLHKARMARNWVGHKDAEQKIEPKWKYVEFALNLSEELVGL